MPVITCHVPLTVKLSGQPRESDWAALEEALVAQYNRAIERGLVEIARAGSVAPSNTDAVREPFAPERLSPTGYAVPGYRDGHLTRLPMRESPPGGTPPMPRSGSAESAEWELALEPEALRLRLEEVYRADGRWAMVGFVDRHVESIRSRITQEEILYSRDVSGGTPWTPEEIGEAASRKRRLEDVIHVFLQQRDGLLRDLDALAATFESDVKAVALGHLLHNRDLVLAEMRRLGLLEPASPALSGADDRLSEVREAAVAVAQVQAALALLRRFPVGYMEVYSHVEDPKPDLTEVMFDPEERPLRGARGDEQPPFRTWDELSAQYQRGAAIIAWYANRYPALYAVLREGERALSMVASGTRAEARDVLGNALRRVLENIEATVPKLDNDDLDYRDLKPIHTQFFAGQLGPSNVAWNQPLPRAVADDILAAYEATEFWKALGLGTLGAAAFIFASLATGGTAAGLFAAGLGISGLQAGISWERYQDLAVAAAASATGTKTLVEQRQVTEALVSAILDTALVFVDAGDVAVRSLRALRGTRQLTGDLGESAAGAAVPSQVTPTPIGQIEPGGAAGRQRPVAGDTEVGGGPRKPSRETPRRDRLETPQEVRQRPQPPRTTIPGLPRCRGGSLICPLDYLHEEFPVLFQQRAESPFADYVRDISQFELRMSRSLRRSQTILTGEDMYRQFLSEVPSTWWSAPFKEAIARGRVAGMDFREIIIRGRRYRWPLEDGRPWVVHHDPPLGWVSAESNLLWHPMPERIHNLAHDWWRRFEATVKDRLREHDPGLLDEIFEADIDIREVP